MKTLKKKKLNIVTRKNNNKITYDFIIKNIFDIDKETLKELDVHQTKCWKENDKISRFQTSWVKKNKRKFYVIYLQNKENKIIFSAICSEQKINNENFIYLRGVCVSPCEQGKGIYKSSLQFIKEYFKRKGIHTIKLNADTQTVNEIDELTRLKIFHKSGLTIDPITIDYRNNNKIYDTIVKLKDNSYAKILSYKDGKYKVQTLDDEKFKFIELEDIDLCTINKKQYYCPLIMHM